jgi:hypothetical protein
LLNVELLVHHVTGRALKVLIMINFPSLINSLYGR